MPSRRRDERQRGSRCSGRRNVSVADNGTPGSLLRSQGKNTPFLGIEVMGKVRWTLLTGRVVHEA